MQRVYIIQFAIFYLGAPFSVRDRALNIQLAARFQKENPSALRDWREIPERNLHVIRSDRTILMVDVRPVTALLPVVFHSCDDCLSKEQWIEKDIEIE